MGTFFRYIDIGNNYRLLLGDKIEKHVAVLEPVGGAYKLPGEGYGDANSILIHVSEKVKLKDFNFHTAPKSVNNQKLTIINLCSGLH
jgi:hypothetical protein